jgi:hypothetical protein
LQAFDDRIPVFNSSPKASEYRLMVKPISLLCLNIPSYMGGVMDMWGKSKKRSPILKETMVVKGKKKKKYVYLKNEQSMNDGSLEFLSFTSKIRMGMLERAFRGGGKRTAQGKRVLRV